MNPAFDVSTRLKLYPMAALTRPTGGGVSQVDLPKAGILAGIILNIRGAVAGSLSNPNVNGMASIIRRATLRVNAGQVIYDTSGVGYHYLVRDFINANGGMCAYGNARAAVTATTFTLDMYIPVAKDIRDQMGLFSLQNQGTLANLQIDWEGDTTVATGATVTGTVTPTLVLYELPVDVKAWPTFDTIHQVIEEQAAIPSTAEYVHNIAIGGTILGQYYHLPLAWSNSELWVQQSNLLYKFSPESHQVWYDLISDGRDLTLAGALTGVNKRVLLDFCGSDGLGQFGSLRDVIDTNALSSFYNKFTPVAPQTLYAVRRQIVNLD